MSAVVLAFGVSALSAQSPWFLNGEVGANFGKSADKTKTTKFNINPAVGYMLNDNWGLTLDLGYGYKSEKPDGKDAVKTEINTFGAGLGVIYKLSITDKFYYAPTFRVGYERAKEAKMNFIGADLNFLRFELRPACHWGLNFNFGGLGYLNSKQKDADNSANSFGFTVGNAAAVGFTYYF